MRKFLIVLAERGAVLSIGSACAALALTDIVAYQIDFGIYHEEFRSAIDALEKPLAFRNVETIQDFDHNTVRASFIVSIPWAIVASLLFLLIYDRLKRCLLGRSSKLRGADYRHGERSMKVVALVCVERLAVFSIAFATALVALMQSIWYFMEF